MIEFLLMMPLVMGAFYLLTRIEDWYADSEFLVNKAQQIEKGEDWDRKEF